MPSRYLADNQLECLVISVITIIIIIMHTCNKCLHLSSQKCQAYLVSKVAAICIIILQLSPSADDAHYLRVLPAQQ